MSRDFSVERAIYTLQTAIDLLRADRTGRYVTLIRYAQQYRDQLLIQRRDETIAELLRRHSDIHNPDAVAESIVDRLSKSDEKTP